MWLAVFFFFKQKTAYEISVRDWSSDGALPISLQGEEGEDRDLPLERRRAEQVPDDDGGAGAAGEAAEERRGPGGTFAAQRSREAGPLPAPPGSPEEARLRAGAHRGVPGAGRRGPRDLPGRRRARGSASGGREGRLQERRPPEGRGARSLHLRGGCQGPRPRSLGRRLGPRVVDRVPDPEEPGRRPEGSAPAPLRDRRERIREAGRQPPGSPASPDGGRKEGPDH